MKELQNISYSNDYNRLAVYLLKMCKSENENPKEQIENLLKLNVDKKMIYLILVNMLHFCQVKNSEKLWIILYFRLEKENFNGSENIQDRILNDMLEAQCDLILENI